MKRLLHTSTAFAVFLGALAAPASAGYTTQLSVANSPANAVCPVKVQFNGSVVGAPYTQFQYWFVYLVNGVEQVTPKTTALMQRSAVAPVAYSLTITTSSDQTTSNIVELHASDLAGQAETISNQVKYFVTCAPPPRGFVGAVSAKPTPTPTPIPVTPKYGSLIGAIGTIAPPKLAEPRLLFGAPGLSYCVESGLSGGDCKNAQASQALVLVWDWKQNAASCQPNCIGSVDGYRIYHAPGSGSGMSSKTAVSGPRTAVAYSGADVTAAILSQGRYRVGDCFVVKAVKGATESPDSPTYCVRDADVARTFSGTFKKLSHLRSPHKHAHSLSGVCNTTTEYPIDSSQNFTVGYMYTGDEYTVKCNAHDSDIWRGAVVFDLSSLAGKLIRNATLHFGSHLTTNLVKTPLSIPPFVQDTQIACGTEIGTGRDAWWGSAGWIEFDSFASGIPSGGGAIDIDVTAQIRRWSAGDPNYGFVMRGATEAIQQSNFRWGCLSYYSDISLAVEYYRL